VSLLARIRGRGLHFEKSSECASNECVEVTVVIRDARGRQISVPPSAFAAFRAGIRAGEFDDPGKPLART
jgi:Domain of unknown function (DUF397)